MDVKQAGWTNRGFVNPQARPRFVLVWLLRVPASFAGQEVLVALARHRDGARSVWLRRASFRYLEGGVFLVRGEASGRAGMERTCVLYRNRSPLTEIT